MTTMDDVEMDDIAQLFAVLDYSRKWLWLLDYAKEWQGNLISQSQDRFGAFGELQLLLEAPAMGTPLGYKLN